MVGIISNSAALFAQRNLDVASSQSELSIARLSSGQSIIRASDDVSGLAIGTVLSTTVSTLKTVLTSTSQANSLLSIADGGLKNVSDILQRQKSLAVSSLSGSLSDNERAFLNEEFTNLTAEIDRLVDGTEFNGIKLINGGISGTAGVTTVTGDATEEYSLDAVADYSAAGTATGVIDAVGFAGNETTAATYHKSVLQITTAGGAGDTLAITFGTDTAVNVTTGASAQLTAEAISKALNESAGADAGKFQFAVQNGNQVTMTAGIVGTSLNNTALTITDTDAARVFDLDGTAYAAGAGTAGAVALDDAAGNGAVTGTAGVFAATVTAGNYDTTMMGAITGLSAAYSGGEDLGSGGFRNNTVTFTAVINGETYTSQEVDLVGDIQQDGAGATTAFGDTIADDTVLKFFKNGADRTDGVSINLTVNGAQTLATDNQAGADTIATSFQTAITNATISVNQTRELSSYTEADLIGTSLEGLNPTAVTMIADTYSSTGTLGDIGSFSFNKDTHKLTVTVDSVEYTADLTVAAEYTGTYTSGTNTITTDGEIRLRTAGDTTDAKELRIDLSDGVTTGSIQLNTAAQVTSFQTAINTAFGVGDNESLAFQVGTVSTDKIGVSIGSAKTADIYKDADGTAVTLSIATAGAASADNGGDGTGSVLAANVIDRALNSVTSLRATVGALQSRFDFAAANITSSIQNTEAARSDFLDVDIAAESTAFATSQVRLQASISVLAQANQIPQNLLKLIG